MFIYFFSFDVLEQEDMNRKKNPCVFLDVSTDGDPMERVVIEVCKISHTSCLFEFLACFTFYKSKLLACI